MSLYLRRAIKTLQALVTTKRYARIMVVTFIVSVLALAWWGGLILRGDLRPDPGSLIFYDTGFLWVITERLALNLPLTYILQITLMAVLLGLTFGLFAFQRKCKPAGRIPGIAAGVTGIIGGVVGTAFCCSPGLVVLSAVVGGSIAQVYRYSQYVFVFGASVLAIALIYAAGRAGREEI